MVCSLPLQRLRSVARVAAALGRACGGVALALLVCIGAGAGPVSSVEAAAPVAVPSPANDRTGSAADLELGARLFQAHCVGCHAGGGNVIRHGRTLRLDALRRADLASPEAIARVAAEGRGQMAGYGTVLGAGGADQVAAWVWRQAQAGWPRKTSLHPAD